MTTDWKKTTQQGWIDAIEKDGYDIVGTLKFYNGRSISKKNALAIHKAYWHKVDRTLFGMAADKGYGVERWCFTEYGKDEKNLHIHFVAKSPLAVLPTCTILNALWVGINRCTANANGNWITPIQDPQDAIGYVVKDTRHLKTDKIGEATSHTNIPGTNLEAFDTEAQIRRITSRLSNDQLTASYQALEMQIIETTKRAQKRQARKNRTL